MVNLKLETEIKKLSYILFIAASVCAAACSKEVAYDEKSSSDAPSDITIPEEELVTYTLLQVLTLSLLW